MQRTSNTATPHSHHRSGPVTTPAVVQPRRGTPSLYKPKRSPELTRPPARPLPQVHPPHRRPLFRLAHPVQLCLPQPVGQLYPDAQGVQPGRDLDDFVCVQVAGAESAFGRYCLCEFRVPSSCWLFCRRGSGGMRTRLSEGSSVAAGCSGRRIEGVISHREHLQRCITGSDRTQIRRFCRSWIRKLIEGELLGGGVL